MKTRVETDLLGNLQIEDHLYYGIHTQRALNNFKISNTRIGDFPFFIKGLIITKRACASANKEIGTIPLKKADMIIQACDEIINNIDKYTPYFPSDVFQGGAGTSVNMNTNEVIANVALTLNEHPKGAYDIIHPNDHVNKSQSTNDAYPTGFRVAIYYYMDNLIDKLTLLITEIEKKSVAFKNVLKMGRTQLQDAVPMTLGQEFEAFATTLEEEIIRLNNNADLFLEINMGATAIGTGLNAPEGYPILCAKNLAEITGINFVSAPNLVEATPDTGSYVIYSSALKRMSIKLSKICNDLRLLSSGPRCGLNEINLPPMQAGSSIMPGKINPVIPEVVNQVCFKVIGNDLTVTFAAEAGQLQLNVMEPVLAYSIIESILLLEKAMDTLTLKCVNGITANEEVCKNMVYNSIGIVTALNPHIGYKNSSKIAKEALNTGESVYSLVLKHKLLTQDKLDEILNPNNMLKSH